MKAPVTGLLTAALIAAIPAASALGATAGVQDDRMPVTPAAGLPARVALLQQTGARVTRVDLYWSTAAPTRPGPPPPAAGRAHASCKGQTVCGEAARAGRQAGSTRGAPRGGVCLAVAE